MMEYLLDRMPTWMHVVLVSVMVVLFAWTMIQLVISYDPTSYSVEEVR